MRESTKLNLLTVQQCDVIMLEIIAICKWYAITVSFSVLFLSVFLSLFYVTTIIAKLYCIYITIVCILHEIINKLNNFNGNSTEKFYVQRDANYIIKPLINYMLLSRCVLYVSYIWWISYKTVIIFIVIFIINII